MKNDIDHTGRVLRKVFGAHKRRFGAICASARGDFGGICVHDNAIQVAAFPRRFYGPGYQGFSRELSYVFSRDTL